MKELDEKFEYLEEARSEGLPVPNKLLLHRASEIAGGLGLQSFKCSSMEGQIQCWLSTGTNTSQNIPAVHADQIFKVRKEIIHLRKKHMIEPSQIYNMDQTMCHFDMPKNRTNARRGGSTIRIKTTRAEKKGFTVALPASASGEKLPAVIKFKERGGRLGACVFKKLVITSNVHVSTVFHFMQYW